PGGAAGAAAAPGTRTPAAQPPGARASAAASDARPGSPAPLRTGQAPAAERFADSAQSAQRVFIKITPGAELKGLLPRLQALLQNHPGPAATLLFYERNQKVLALSDSYRIEPSEELFAAIEEMLGAGTVRLR
ncbi:DNA polymerase III subunit alpha, partial [Paenibacillus rhizoplanae]